MFWFFILPCVGFMVWASFKLMSGLMAPAKPVDVFARIQTIRSARTSADRWQSAYALSQELQRMIHDGELAKMPPEPKQKLYSNLEELLRVHATDARLKRYLLLTLGQMGDLAALPPLEEGLSEKDPEIRFFSAWGFIDVLSKHPEAQTQVRLQTVASWARDSDSSLRKIAGSFLAQQKSPLFFSQVLKLLSDSDVEVRWNTAVALASTGHLEAVPVLSEMFDLQKLRALDMKTGKDLRQLVASGYAAAKKLGNAEVLSKAQSLRQQAKPQTAEGRAILGALKDSRL